MNKNHNATHYDPLHAAIAWATYIIDAFTLEQLRAYPDKFEQYENKARKDWTREMRTEFTEWTKGTRRLFQKMGVYCGKVGQVTGGVMRKLADEHAHEQLLAIFVPNRTGRDGRNRRDVVREVLKDLVFVNSVLRAPDVSLVCDVPTLKMRRLVPIGRNMLKVWPELRFRQYIHITFEHTQEMIERYGTVGLWSTEGSESINKIVRITCERQARSTTAKAAVDIMYSIMRRNQPGIRSWLLGEFEY